MIKERKSLASSPGAVADKQIEGRRLKEAISASEHSLAAVKATLDSAAQRLPCDSHPRAPVGPEDVARVAFVHGTQPVFAFQPRSHEELGEALGLFDTAAGVAIAGAGFNVLRGDGVLLEAALVRWALDRVRVR